ncbi:MAG: PIG-L deacetylase family protein [Verrucomicrobiota bacterium]
MSKTALTILAHPDDAEFTCAGTLKLLHDQGWDIHIATMTPGDAGSAEHSREEISTIRRQEAAAAAAKLNGEYHCLECSDVFIMYDSDSLLKVVEVIRRVKPDVVFTASPEDYFVDHENTSRLAWTACFACGIPNVETPGVEPHDKIPHLYYVDAMEGKDKYGKSITPAFYVDISSSLDMKEEMLCCHDSQRSWLMKHHGMDKYTAIMKEFAAQRGGEIKADYAEGFRQHLGHGFPQENILTTEIPNTICEKGD